MSQKAYVINRKLENDVEKKLHIKSINAVFWREVKGNLNRFVIYGLTNLILLMLGSLVFFYIEHCHAVKPKNLNIGEDSFIKICEKHLPEMLSENATSSATKAIHELCEENKAAVLDERECVLNVLEFFKWMEYTLSVAFTLGKYMSSI